MNRNRWRLRKIELRVPGLQLFRLLGLGVLPENAIDRDVAGLTDNIQLLCIISQPLEQIQAVFVAQGTQCLCGLMATHRILFCVVHHMLEV